MVTIKRKDRKAIAIRLHISRQAAGFSRAKDFAFAYGLNIAAYCQHEHGVRTPRFNTLATYAELLGIPLAWLINGSIDSATSCVALSHYTVMVEDIAPLKSTGWIAARLRASREILGFKETDDSALTPAFDKIAFQEYENARLRPCRKTLATYAKLFGVSFEWLANGVGHPLTN